VTSSLWPGHAALVGGEMHPGHMLLDDENLLPPRHPPAAELAGRQAGPSIARRKSRRTLQAGRNRPIRDPVKIDGLLLDAQITAAVARKAQSVQRQLGQAAVDLIEAAGSTAPASAPTADGRGAIINTKA
jgi:hypothetical protein